MATRTIGAYAVRRSDPDNPLLADSQETLNKVIALYWIGEWKPPNENVAQSVREAILDERWGDAVLGWMNATGEQVDVFPHGIAIHQAEDYPDSEFGPRIQVSALFRPT